MIPSLVPHSRNFTLTYTHTHTHAHTSCASHHPCVSFLIRPFPSTLAARQLFYRSSAVLCCLLKASHRETTPCESSLFLTTPPILSPSRASHPSHPEWRSWVCLSSPRPARPFQNPLTNSLTHSLTRSHSLRAVCFSWRPLRMLHRRRLKGGCFCIADEQTPKLGSRPVFLCCKRSAQRPHLTHWLRARSVES